jgi:hypothetical protein
MFGKKIRLYHHGMKKQCNNCYSIGHLKKDCDAAKVQWLEYVEKLRKSGRFEDQMFGNWIEILKEESEKASKPAREKPDLRRYLSDPDALKNALASYLEGKERGRQQSQHANRQRNDRQQSSGSRGSDNRERDSHPNGNRSNNDRYDNRPNGRGNNWRRGDNRRGSPEGRKRHQNNNRNYNPKKDKRA